MPFLALDFPQLLDALGKRLKFHINVQQGLKKFLNDLLDLSFYWTPIISIFPFLENNFLFSDVITVFKIHRSSQPEVFLGKCVLKICNKFTGEHTC